MLQKQYHALRPLTTAHLAQTMTLLSLTSEELRQEIDAELSKNPALELVEERRCPTCHRMIPEGGVCPVCSQPSIMNPDEPIVFLSPRDDFIPKSDYAEDSNLDEPYSASQDELPTYVLKQIAPDLEEEERPIAAFLLTHLNEDGLLTVSLFEVARYCHASLEQVQSVQSLIQHADPVGVGSSSTRDAMLVQLEVLAETRKIPELAVEIVRDGLELISHRQYGELARKYETTARQIQTIGQFITENLNPFPGRAHWGDVREPTSMNVQVYHQPDIIISYLNENPQNPLVVEIIMPIRGTLRVNPLFRQVIRETQEDTRVEMKSDMERASLFVKCLQQRNHTMERLLSRLVSWERDFIIHGEEHHKPITRAEVARDLEVHESTISRGVANKAVQLPNKKIVPLALFFDRSLKVRTLLRRLIETEPQILSDSDLVELLKERGYEVKRRTVAKYRAMEGILPAHLRRQK